MDDAKRSPIQGRARRQAGEGLRQRVSENREWFWLYGAGIVIGAFLLIAVSWLDWLIKGPTAPWSITFSGVVVAALFPFAAWKRWKNSENDAKGLRGELAAAEWLEELQRAGYHVFHDLPCTAADGRACNIDHLAVGPAGVLVVETKFRSKGKGEKVEYDGERLRVGGQDEARTLRQARTCRDDVRRRLERIGLGAMPVRAVVVFPGWDVKEVSGAEVWVLNPKRRLAVWAGTEARRNGECDREWVRRAVEYCDGWAREA